MRGAPSAGASCFLLSGWSPPLLQDPTLQLEQHLAQLGPILDKLPAAHRTAISEALGVIKRDLDRKQARESFLAFVKKVWPGFIEGPHHRIMADAFQRIADGKLKRLIINIAPRHGKSELTSYLLPAWYIGNFPNKKLISATHTADLSVNFGRKVRNLVSGEAYRDIFPNVSLSADSKAAGRWETSGGGEFYAVGVGGAITGRGADLLVIDDPHAGDQIGAEPQAADFAKAYEWYQSGPRQRLQPGGAIALVMTRWGAADLCGQIIRAAKEREGSDKWEVINFPALNERDEPLWPEFWPQKELLATRSEIASYKWSCQYQQNPIAAGASIVRREWIKWWDQEDPPKIDYLILSIDPAHTKGNRADFSALTVWGVFQTVEEGGLGAMKNNLILLDALNERLEFPELKAKTLEVYKWWKPDTVIIEAKAAGLPLSQELRAIGVPLRTYTPSRGQDKVVRVNSIADMFASGIIWMPRLQWAEKVADQFQEFPNGEHDDLLDASTQALMYFRQGSFVRLPTDWEDKETKGWSKIPEYY